MRPTLLLLFVGVLLTTISVASVAKAGKQKPPTFVAGQAGFEIQKEFSKLSTNCAPVLNGNHASPQALPPQINGQTELLTSSVMVIPRGSLSKFLGYVWPTNTITSEPEYHDPSRQLGALPRGLDGQLTPDKRNNALEYTQNCTGSALVSASAKGGIKVINLAAALDGESKASDELMLSNGTFYSPFHLAYANLNPGRRLPALASLWEYYGGLGADTSSAGFYVSGFEGTVITLGSREERHINASAQASLGIGAPLFSVSSTAQLAYERSAKTVINEFVVLADYTGTPDNARLKAKLESLPTLDQVVDRSSDVPVEATFSDGLANWSKGQNYVVRLGIRNLPSSMRDPSLWKVELAGIDLKDIGVSSLRSVDPADGELESEYVMRFTISPLDKIFADPKYSGGSLQFSGRLVYTLPVRGRHLLTRPFALAANVVTAFQPTYVEASGGKITPYGAQSESLKVSWRLDFQIADLQSVDLDSAVTLSSFKIPCVNSGSTRVSGPVQWGSQSKTFSASVELLMGMGKELGSSWVQADRCNASATVELATRSGKRVTRALQFVLEVPR